MAILLSENEMKIANAINAALALSGFLASIWMIYSLVGKIRRTEKSSQDPIIYKMLLLVAGSDALGTAVTLIFCSSKFGIKALSDFIHAGGIGVTLLAELIYVTLIFTFFIEALLVFQVYQMTTSGQQKRLKYTAYCVLMMFFIVIRLAVGLFSSSMSKSLRGVVDCMYTLLMAFLWIYFFCMLVILPYKLCYGQIYGRLRHIVKRVVLLIIVLVVCFAGVTIGNSYYCTQVYLLSREYLLQSNDILIVLQNPFGRIFYTLNVVAYGASKNCLRMGKSKPSQANSFTGGNFIHPWEVEIVKEEILGSGATGTVFKGIFRGTIVAVKQLWLPEPRVGTHTLAKREYESFLSEAMMLSQLIHPNIIYYMGAFVSGHHGYIVCEYCDSGSLRDVLTNFKRSEVEVNFTWICKIALGIAYGVNYLHEMDLVHRDLKSPTVLVVDIIKAKVADFGTAKLVFTLAGNRSSATDNYSSIVSLHTTRIGTARWTAPEVLLQAEYRRGDYNKAIDVYSFGIMLWELISRQIPYPDVPYTFDVKEKVLKGERPDISTNSHLVPSDYLHLMGVCWSPDPKERPSMHQVIATLQKLHEKLLNQAPKLRTLQKVTATPIETV